MFAAVYSPSLGPIPFTLASESFPLAQREAVRNPPSTPDSPYVAALTRYAIGKSKLTSNTQGCSVAIAVNLFFAGILTLLYPELDPALKHWGGLALFSALNLVAFVLVFLLVEETKGFSLEDLSMVFAVPKHKFVAFQLRYMGYLYRKYLRGKDEEEPEFYTVAVDYRRNNQPDASVPGGDESDTSDE